MTVIHPALALQPVHAVLLAAALFVGGAMPTQAKPSGDAGLRSALLPSCSWDRPGHDPFMGDVVAAVDHFSDIAPEVRARLKARVARRDYDDMVSIRRDSITGRARYGSTIHDMHFGDGRVCHGVTRASWSPTMQERGLVYCDSGQCILVPTVCRNISRITRAEVSPEHAEAPDDPEAAGLPALPDGMGDGPLAMDTAPSFEPRAARPESISGIAAAPSSASDDGRPAEGAGGPNGDAHVPIALPLGGIGGVSGPGTGNLPSVVTTPVPEPSTWAGMLAGLAGLLAMRRGWFRPR